MRVLRLDESTAALRRIFFVLLDSATGAVKQTGQSANLTGFVTKAGAAGVELTGTFVEIDSGDMPGLYYYQAVAGELDTTGRAVFEFAAPTCLTRTIVVHVGAVSEDLATAVAVAALPSAAANAIATDALLSASHGAGEWGTESTGAMPVTITVTDSVTSLAVPGVLVYIRNAAATMLFDWGITDENGQVGFLLDNGSFRAWCTKVGSYTFANPTTLTVSGVTTLAISATPFSPTTPVSPDLCTVYGWTLDIQGAGKSVVIEADVIGDVHFLTAHQEIVRGAKTASSASADGYWEIALTRSARYTTSVKYAISVNRVPVGTFTIPDVARVGLDSLAVS